MKIFFDLDDTLIHSIHGGNNRNRIYRRFVGDGSYGSIVRPTAYELLSFARFIDPSPAMITTATRDWADEWNETFDFGFTEIYSREDFMNTVSADYGRSYSIWNGKCLNINDFVIIDNYEWDDSSPIMKQQFIHGEPVRERWVTIKEFSGITNKDWVTADKKHINEIQKKIIELSKKSVDTNSEM